MAQIRLRVEINQGRIGAPLEKLADVSRQLERFLRALSADLRIDVKKGEWLGVNFGNGSVKWDAALQVEVSDSMLQRFNDSVEFVADYDPDVEGSNGRLSDSTLLEYGKIGSHIEPDEVVSLGLYATSASKKPKKWRQVTYRKAARVRQAMETPIVSYGSVQGIMHSWVKEGVSPHFHIRELSTDTLIRCLYQPRHYGSVVEAFRDKVAVVFVTGPTKSDRARRQIEELRVDRIDKPERLSQQEFQSFFGSAAELTGKLPTQAFIDKIREDG